MELTHAQISIMQGIDSLQAVRLMLINNGGDSLMTTEMQEAIIGIEDAIRKLSTRLIAPIKFVVTAALTDDALEAQLLRALPSESQIHKCVFHRTPYPYSYGGFPKEATNE